MELKEIQHRARFGPAIMLGRRAFAALIGLLTTVVMPHFLTPAAYGLATMATMVFTLGEMFKDFGLGAAMLRKGDIQADEMSFLFWFSAGSTLIVSAVIAASAPLAARFFQQPAVTGIILVSLVGFVIGGIAMQHRSLLNRNLHFGDIALIDSVSLLLQFLLTLVLAMHGAGVWSIVAGNICYNIVNGSLCVLRGKWKPGPPKIIAELKAILAFGANSSIYSLTVFISTNITSILIGYTQKVESLGQYNRANAFLSLPLNNLVEPLAQATLPVLARLRPFPDQYRDTYLAFVQRLNLVVMPPSIFLIFAAHPLILAILGPNWREAGDLLALLAPVIGVLGFGYAVSDLFITQDRSAELRTLGLVEMIVRVGAVFIGIRFGLYAAATAYVAATILMVIVRIYVAGRKGPVSFPDHLKTILPSLPICMGVGLGAWAGLYAALIIGADALGQAIIAIAASAVLGCAAMLSVGRSREAVFSLFRALRPAPATIQD